jgi:hypothetical protein
LTTQTQTIERIAPAGYAEAQYWRISEKKSNLVLLQVLAIVLTLLWGLVFYLTARSLGRTQGNVPNDTTVMFIAFLVILPIHELIHGLTMWIFGAHPRYGVMWKELMFYATSPGYPFRRNQFLAVTYAPFVVISILTVAGLALLPQPYMVWPIIAAGAGNAGGAIGDMWISTVVMRHPPSAMIMDEKDGVRVFVIAEPEQLAGQKPELETGTGA